MTTFLKTARGDLLNLANVTKLHVDYASLADNDGLILSADKIPLSKPDKKATEAEMKLQLEILAMCTASATDGHGIFSIKKGQVHRQTLNGRGPALVMRKAQELSAP